jgi:hypothetical protein
MGSSGSGSDFIEYTSEFVQLPAEHKIILFLSCHTVEMNIFLLKMVEKGFHNLGYRYRTLSRSDIDPSPLEESFRTRILNTA